MIRLNQTASQLLSIITTQNGANVVVSYSDKTTTSYNGNTQVTNVVSAATTTICDTPAASTIRDIDHISIKNTFAGSHTITVQVSSSATLYPIFQVALLTDEVAEYTHGSGWRCFDANGNLKTTPLTAMTSAQLAAILSDETGTGSAVFATGPTLSLPNANNFRNGLTSTATAAGTTTLTSSSNYQQMFTGTTTQTVVMPDATTLVVGHAYYLHNESTGAITVNANGGGGLVVMAAGTGAIFVCTSVATAAGSWDFEYFSIISASGKKLTNSNTLTLAGTDNTTMTFPTTSATIARTDAAQVFTGVHTFGEVDVQNLNTESFTKMTQFSSNSNVSNSQYYRKSHQNTVGFTTTVNNEYLGSLAFQGVNSGATNWATGAVITVQQTGTAGATYIPAAFSFQVSDGTSVYSERLKVSSTGISSPAAILSSGATDGVGYTTGAGGTVTQATSRTTGVTLNKVTGAITLVSAAGSTTPSTFTVTNSAVAATDNIIVQQKSGTDLYNIHVTAIAAGSFNITFWTTGGTTTEQPVFNFSVIKGVTA